MPKSLVGVPYKRKNGNWNAAADYRVQTLRKKIGEPAKPARLRITPKRVVVDRFETAKSLLGALADERNWIRVPRRDGTVVLAYTLSNDVPTLIANCLDAMREMELRCFK
jgi:hypothetical protein